MTIYLTYLFLFSNRIPIINYILERYKWQYFNFFLIQGRHKEDINEFFLKFSANFWNFENWGTAYAPGHVVAVHLYIIMVSWRCEGIFFCHTAISFLTIRIRDNCVFFFFFFCTYYNLKFIIQETQLKIAYCGNFKFQLHILQSI